MCAAHLAARQYMTLGLDAIRALRACFILPMLIVPLIILRKQMWQATITIAMGFMCYTVISGISGYMASKLSPGDSPLYMGVSGIAAAALALPLIIIVLRLIYTNPTLEQITSFWRLAWVIPAMLSVFAIAAQVGYALGKVLDRQLVSFIAATYVISLLTVYLFDVLARSNTSSYTSGFDCEEKETEILQKIGVKISTPLAAISADVSVAQHNPHELDEPLTKAQSRVMEIADIIRDTLEDEK